MKRLNKIFKFVALSAAAIMILAGIGPINIDGLDRITWFKTGQVEKVAKIRFTTSELSGDSMRLPTTNKPCLITDVFVSVIDRGTEYTDNSATDTVKIYGMLGSTPVAVGYLSNSTFTTDPANEPFLSYTPLTTGTVSGYTWYIVFPSGKLTGGTNILDLYIKYIEMR